jgi:thioredoxin 1
MAAKAPFVLVKDEADFEREVLKATGPVLVQFFADWCGPCRQMSAVLDELVELHPGTFKLAKIDIDEERSGELISHYGVKAVPCFLVCKGGEIVGRQIGFQMRASFWQWLLPLLKK